MKMGVTTPAGEGVEASQELTLCTVVNSLPLNTKCEDCNIDEHPDVLLSNVALVQKVLDCLSKYEILKLRLLTECVYGKYEQKLAEKVRKVLTKLQKLGIVKKVGHGYYKLLIGFNPGQHIFLTISNVDYDTGKDLKGCMTLRTYMKFREEHHVHSLEEGINIPLDQLPPEIRPTFTKIKYVQVYKKQFSELVNDQQFKTLLNKLNTQLLNKEVLHIDLRHEGPKLIHEDPDLSIEYIKIIAAMIYAVKEHLKQIPLETAQQIAKILEQTVREIEKTLKQTTNHKNKHKDTKTRQN